MAFNKTRESHQLSTLWCTLVILIITTLTSVLGYSQIKIQPEPPPQTEGPEKLFGIWGTDNQCTAHAGGNRIDQRLFPVVISNEWIQQGWIYCYLQWYDTSSTASITQATAFAQCGEDTIRDYQLIMELTDDQLQIQWSSTFTSSPLRRCE